MTDPLVVLDPSGHATVLSYDVPEPMSYSGRNFIDLALPSRAFRGVGASGAPAAGLTVGSREAPTRTAAARSAPAVVAPPGVTVSMLGDRPAVTSSRPLSPRLAELRADAARTLVQGGRQLVVYPTTMGRLDYRIVDRGRMLPALARQRTDGGDGGDSGGGDRTAPAVYIAISTPAGGTLASPDSTLRVTVAGTFTAEDVSGVAMTLAVDGGAPVPLSPGSDGSSWSADLDITVAGTHTLLARISGEAVGKVAGNRYTVRDEASVALTVTLGDGGGDGALPAVTLTTPRGASTVYGQGTLSVPLAGTALGHAGAAVTTVRVTDAATGSSVDIPPDAETGAWSMTLAVDGEGVHDIGVVAVDALGRLSPKVGVAVTVVAEQPRRRTVQRLMIVETLNISSFLGSFGAGRCLKTFSLLPGEKATMSVKTWTKSDESRKQGSSILDSSATDSESSWEDSLAKEQTSKESLTETSNYKITADVGATWGWGHADVHGEYSGSANSTREGAVKNVLNALQKHSLTASTNRSVTINSEYTVSTEAGTEESTTREISNINVSRVLNVVFRQMNQEHVVLVHLTNVRVAFYAEDLLLASDGSPDYVHTDPHDTTSPLAPHVVTSYDEVSLADLQDLLDRHVLEEFQQSTITGIKNALSGVPDHEGNLHEVFEVVVPKKDGVEVPEATYLRFPAQLRMTYEHSGAQFTVPGVVLATDTVVMRTDAVVADTVLGAGDGLDAYSHGLQEAVVAERQAQLAQRMLAIEIVKDNDAERAALYARLFPVAPVPVTTTTTSTTPPVPAP